MSAAGGAKQGLPKVSSDSDRQRGRADGRSAVSLCRFQSRQARGRSLAPAACCWVWLHVAASPDRPLRCASKATLAKGRAQQQALGRLRLCPRLLAQLARLLHRFGRLRFATLLEHRQAGGLAGIGRGENARLLRFIVELRRFELDGQFPRG